MTKGNLKILLEKCLQFGKSFLLHIIKPSDCPIFDQHVYRAFRFIQYQDDKLLRFTRTARINVFYKEYYPFFLDMKDLADEYDHF